jgi:hypothetical protein
LIKICGIRVEVRLKNTLPFLNHTPIMNRLVDLKLVYNGSYCTSCYRVGHQSALGAEIDKNYNSTTLDNESAP